MLWHDDIDDGEINGLGLDMFHALDTIFRLDNRYAFPLERFAKEGALAIMAVFVAFFAGTTPDTATRIQRYVLSELFISFKLDFFTGKYTATAIAAWILLEGIIKFFSTEGDSDQPIETAPVL